MHFLRYLRHLQRKEQLVGQSSPIVEAVAQKGASTPVTTVVGVGELIQDQIILGERHARVLRRTPSALMHHAALQLLEEEEEEKKRETKKKYLSLTLWLGQEAFAYKNVPRASKRTNRPFICAPYVFLLLDLIQMIKTFSARISR
jgi:hypothetical protein